MSKASIGLLFALAAGIAAAADPALVNVSADPGTNFTSVIVSGELTVDPPANPVDCVVRAVIRSVRDDFVREASVGRTAAGPFAINVDKLEPGCVYSAVVQLEDKSGSPFAGSTVTSVVTTARRYDGRWIRENTNTFSGVETATGDWRYRTTPIVAAKVAGTAIRIESELSESVTFDATNAAQTAVNSSIREFSFEICSSTPGYYLSAPEYAAVQRADLAGVTIVCDDLHDGAHYLSVYNPEGAGSWHILDDQTVELNRLYVITVVITYPNPGKTTPSTVAYFLEQPGGGRRRLVVFDCATAVPEIVESYRNRLRFSGNGLVKKLEGACYDAHLAAVEGGAEYWTIAEAMHDVGTSGRTLIPLWPSTYKMDMAQGRIGIRDPHVPPYLTLTWPLGYVAEITEVGDVRYYAFSISDYWTDWADAGDVVARVGGWEVKSANGLAWIARESSAHPLVGDITLTADITNLFEHIWSPINGFTGTFDGKHRTITGLTDKGVDCAVTNADGVTAYGLFGLATNSVFRNVVLEGVAISNSADAVAALLGCSVGDLAITNVTVRSGKLAGGGQFVSGVVGYVGDFGKISFSNAVNAASITATAAPLGGAIVSGLANLGTDAGTPGSVALVGNENRGELRTTIVSEPDGGNVAQIVAGSDSEAQFDPNAVHVSGNIGTGDVSRVVSLNHAGWALPALPVVNLAAEVSRQSEAEGYKEFIEANDATEKLIDPWRKTARMTGAFDQNGATNYAGRLNDRIACALPGETVTLQDDLEIWSSIVLDRAITLNLNGKVIDNVFDTHSFEVTCESGTPTVANGTVTCPKGKLKTGGELNKSSLVIKQWNCDYWDRKLYVDQKFIDSVSLPLLKKALKAGSSIAVPEDSAYSIDAESGNLNLCGEAFVSFASLGYSVRETKDGENTVYVIEIDPDPATPAEISLAISPNGGTSKVIVNGARSDCEYCLQSVTNLAEDWDKSSDEWVSPATDGASLEFTVDTSASSGFYRIKTRKK